MAEKKENPKEHAKLDMLLSQVSEKICEIPHRTTLLGLNRSRAGSKHFGTSIDSQAANNFYHKVAEAINVLTRCVFGKPLEQIVAAELVQDVQTRTLLENAGQIIETGCQNSFECLALIRKAIFLNFENQYCIEDWKDVRSEDVDSSLKHLLFAKKAPHFTRCKQWIDKYVCDYFDYVQLDSNQISRDLMRYGISHTEFYNILRLTPRVYLSEENGWQVEQNPKFLHVSVEDLNYCLSTAIDILMSKQDYDNSHRSPESAEEMPIRLKCDTNLFSKACATSSILKRLTKGDVFRAEAFIPGFDGLWYVKISEVEREPAAEFIQGYILDDDVDSIYAAG
ncbi:MAG: hypothetical protein Q8K75_04590 [Chlamydiales bacterium]|nr:hypothetical protein [Chlamydiales bacterium]